jgi:hypothetical protein
MGDMYTSIRFLKKYMPCNHKRVWEMCTARTGIRKDFSLRNPFDQADFKELYKDVFRKSEKEILLEDGWEPYATEDGSVEITKTVRGLPLETPYEPRVGDHASDDEEFKALLGDMLDSVSQSVKKLNAALDEALVRLPRKTRTLTKAEAEALLTEKLGESVRIE